jgi:hypothetical protein
LKLLALRLLRSSGGLVTVEVAGVEVSIAAGRITGMSEEWPTMLSFSMSDAPEEE